MASDIIHPIESEKKLLTSGELGMAFPMKKLTQYFDSKTSNYKHQNYIKFRLQIIEGNKS